MESWCGFTFDDGEDVDVDDAVDDDGDDVVDDDDDDQANKEYWLLHRDDGKPGEYFSSSRKKKKDAKA